MKKIVFLASIIISANTIAQLPSYVPTNGLVAAYTFNGNANDLSGNTLNGTVFGATLTNDRFGNINSAYSFNGSGNYIAVPFNSTYNMQLSTWIVWVKTTNSSTGNGNYFMGIRDNASHMVCIVEDVGNGNSQIGWGPSQATGVGGLAPLNDGNWHMLVINYDQSLTNNNYNMYYDGQLTSTSTFQPFTLLNGELRFGIEQNSSYWQQLNGSIDDAFIYSRILSVCEIQDLYNAQLNFYQVQAGSDQAICEGDQITLSASGSQNYSWNNGVVDGSPFSPNSTLDYIVSADNNGCQSSDTVTVFVNQPTSSILNETALDTYTLNGQTYTQSGTYTQILPNNEGCDSTITLNLTLNFTGLDQLDFNEIAISPNPTSDFLNISTSENIESVKVFDMNGRLVLTNTYNTPNVKLDVAILQNGFYTVLINENNRQKFIKN